MILCPGSLLWKKKLLKYAVRVGAWWRNVLSVSNLEATSAILFKTPTIEIISRGADLQICCRRARAQSKCPAMSNFAENFLDYWTVEELSHLMPPWTCCSDGRWASKTSHLRSTPAISKSFLDRSLVLRRAIMKGGKFTYQTMKWGLSGPGRIQTPPALRLQASEYP